MSHPIVVQKLLNLSVDEVLASVTDHNARHSKTRENGVLEEALDGIGICLSARKGLHPLGHIINCNQNVLIPFGGRERSHEVHTPHIKEVHLQNGLLGHLTPLGNVAGPLALITRENKSMCILKDCWPKETCLQNLSSCLSGGGMTSISRRMTMIKNRGYLLIWHTSSENTINTYLKEMGLVPKVVLDVRFELLLLLVGHLKGEHTCNQKVSKICIPGCNRGIEGVHTRNGAVWLICR
jgi:hypothetical protein